MTQNPGIPRDAQGLGLQVSITRRQVGHPRVRATREMKQAVQLGRASGPKGSLWTGSPTAGGKFYLTAGVRLL